MTMPVSMQLAITGVEEFQRIHKCYPESFYRTLALEYSRKNLKDLKVPGHKNCNYDEEEICLPNSLPIDIPLCKTRTLKEKMKTANCYLQALLLTEQELKNRSANFKACKIKEYQVTSNSPGPSSEADLKLRISFR